MAQDADEDDSEYRYDCTDCDNHVETGMWREAVDCPECGTGKLVPEEARR